MAKMPPEVIAFVNEGLGQGDNPDRPTKFLATVSNDYKVNVVVLASLMANGEETLMFSDLFLGKTKQNLQVNKQVSVAVVKPPDKGVQIKGTVSEWHTSGPLFKMIQSMAYQRMPTSILGVIVVKVDEVYSLAPGDAGKKIV
jgi:predicted pyridoxine 5'-phosphate oxidase superfamily flavin-nucleotide-binding protein